MKKTKMGLLFLILSIIIGCHDNLDISFKKAQELKKSGSYREAINEYDYILRKDNNNPVALTNRGVIYFLLKENEKALRDFNQAIDFAPNYHLAYYNRAKLKYYINDFQGAIHDCERLYDFNKENINYNLLCSKAYLSVNEHKKVLLHTKQILKENPVNIEALQLEGVSKFRLANFEDALLTFKKIIIIQESNSDALSYLADCYVNLNLSDSAICIFNQLITIDSLEPTVYQKKGYCELNHGNYSEAEKDFTKSLSLEKHHTTFGLRGLARKNQGKYIEAIADYKAGIKLNNKYPILFYNLGVCQSELNQLDSACFNFQKAAQLGMPNAKEMIKKYCD